MPLFITEDQVHRADEFGGYVTVPWAHHLVHEGLLWTLADEDSSVDIASPKEWLFISPVGREIHFSFAIGSSGGALVEFFQEPTVSDNGTGITIMNSDLNITDSPNSTAYYDPTTSVDGTLIRPFRIGSSGGVNFSGGTARPGVEFLLKENTIYLIKVTVTGNGTALEFVADFYEEVE